MPFTPLSARIASLPLILAGPMLRRTEPNAVTVWVALKERARVTLTVQRTRADEGRPDLLEAEQPLTESATTVALGPNLHVVAVTASGASPLRRGHVYAYNLTFSGGRHLAGTGASDALNGPGNLNPATISYFTHRLPTFSLPPDRLGDLRLVHGSCRKPHDPGRDALAILDVLISQERQSALRRPHQLFLTGDQIYAEEVKDPLLWLLIDAAQAVMGHHEELPDPDKTNTGDLQPGHRAGLRQDAALGTHSEGQTRSHILSFGEYCAMYVFAWSQTVWPTSVPEVDDVRAHFDARPASHPLSSSEQRFLTGIQTPEGRARWTDGVQRLEEFRRDLPLVRRALANVPTYMIFDDHDVTDDWFLNRFWTENVLHTPIGKRLVQNALLAYAVFQHWGNVPSAYAANASGGRLLSLASRLTGTARDVSVRRQIDHVLGLPPIDDLSLNAEEDAAATRADGTYHVLVRDAAACLRWDYEVTGPRHAVIVLDTRAWRGYVPGLGNGKRPPAMLSPAAFASQLESRLGSTEAPDHVTCIIAPTNPVGLRIIDLAQIHFYKEYLEGRLDIGVTHLDIGDAWNFDFEAFARLLTTLFSRRKRVVLLSGDIHFGYAVKLSYWGRAPFRAGGAATAPQQGVLAQLTSSALKNADGLEFLTKVLQLPVKPAETRQDWAGWNEKPNLLRRERGSWDPYVIPEIDRSPYVLRIDDDHLGDDEYAVASDADQPDWRYRIAFIRRSLPPGLTKPSFPIPPPTNEQDKRAWLETYHQVMTPRITGGAVWSSSLLPEGEETVGFHNIGVVTFAWPDNEASPTGSRAVIQDLYFWPPGPVTEYYVSRYRVPLQLPAAPPRMRRP